MQTPTMTALSSLSRLNIAFAIVALGLLLSVFGIVSNIHILDWVGLCCSIFAASFAFLSFKKLKENIGEISKVCEAAAHGNLEERIVLLQDTGPIKTLSQSVNHLLDMSDAFVRESKASFDAVEKGNFNRRIVDKGILGSYNLAAKSVNHAIIAMDNKFSGFSELILSAEDTTKRVLGHVIEASARLKNDSNEMLHANADAQTNIEIIGNSASQTTQDAQTVANNANELCASSGAIDAQLMQSKKLNDFTESRIAETRLAMENLSAAMAEIAPIAEIIREVAGQTRLLALNASIEAVRAGSAGIAFAVVAGEVKTLADRTADASDTIVERINSVENTALGARQTIESFVETVVELTAISDEISNAVSSQIISSNAISSAINNTASRSEEVQGQVGNVMAAIKQTSNQAENLSQAAILLGSEAQQLNEELNQFLHSAKKIVSK